MMSTMKEEEDFEYESMTHDELSFEHHACFAHTLQLVIKDGLKKAGPINSVIKRCSNLVAFTRKSTIAADVLRYEKKLQKDNTTRWNSQLKMIRSVLSISEDKLNELENVPPLSAHDRNILKDIVEILTLFEEATDFVQIDQVPSSGYVLPCVKGLAHHLANTCSKYRIPFVSALKASFDKRMPYFEETTTYVLTAVLDPRFKVRWCSNNAEKNNCTRMLKSAADTIIAQTADEGASSSNDSQPPPKKPKQDKSLFNFMEKNNALETTAGVTDEIDKYLMAPCQPIDINPADFWKEEQQTFPALASVAREVLSVPSSSPVERLFSVAGKVFIPERYRLTDKRFQELMFIRCNNTCTLSDN